MSGRYAPHQQIVEMSPLAPALKSSAEVNAIRLNDDFYMVPLDAKVAGCQAYRAFSPSGRVPQAIYYRTADGQFVTDRGQAKCG